MALQAARAVAGEPANRYNPLVIVGASGVGKTHLLHALGNALARAVKGPVACLSAHEFTGELIEAIDRDAVPAWRARYRGAAAFLLDDVHLVAEKDRTQDELFVLFNFLIESGRQMVFTSALPLAEMKAVEGRLRTRLEGGLVVDLPGSGTGGSRSRWSSDHSKPKWAPSIPSWRLTSARVRWSPSGRCMACFSESSMPRRRRGARPR